MSSAISNPPFNLKWDVPMFAQLQNRFSSYELPPASNANYAFILTALDSIDSKACFILPNCVLTTDNKQESEIRKQLIENNLVEAVILCPNKMFESTDITTCVLLLNKEKKNKNIVFVDLRNYHETEKREQRGQFGGASHENRVYTKEFNFLSDEQIKEISFIVKEQKAVDKISAVATFDEVKAQDYTLVPSRYIPFKEKKTPHRSFQEIADNINYISRMRNSCKLVINETIAKQLGLDMEAFKKGKELSKVNQEQMQDLDIKIEVEDYLQFTKNKNEFMFKCNDKELLPDIFIQFFNVWKNQIALLNTMENAYLAELRDALLPDLMSGKLDITKEKK